MTILSLYALLVSSEPSLDQVKLFRFSEPLDQANLRSSEP